MNLPIDFPSEAEQLRQQLQPLADATAQERLLAAADALSAAEALSFAGGRRAEQLRYHDLCERQWRERMIQFLDQHGRAHPQSGE